MTFPDPDRDPEGRDWEADYGVTCGDVCTFVDDAPTMMCELPAGHGWHRRGITTWSHGDPAAMHVELTELAEVRHKCLALRALVAEMLAQFTEAGYPGAPCHRTGWVKDTTITRWQQTYRETS